MPASRQPEETVICSCGCKQLISRRNERRHLQGRGPAYIQAARALRHAPPTTGFNVDYTPPPPAPPSSSLPSSSPMRTLSPPSTPNPLTHDTDLCMPSYPPSPPSHSEGDEPPENSRGDIPAPPDINLWQRVAMHNQDDQINDFSDSEDDSDEEQEDFDPDFDLDDPWQDGAGADAFAPWFEASVAKARADGSLTDDDLRCLEGFNYKVDTCIPGRAFEKLPLAFSNLSNLPSLFRIQSAAARLSGISPISFDCCIRSCCAYTSQYKDLTRCPYCDEDRYTSDGKPRKLYRHIPIIPRFQQLYSSHKSANIHMYRADQDRERSHAPNDTKIRDFCDCSLYQQKRREFAQVNGWALPHRHFSDPRDICLGMSLDGFCPFRRRKQTCWPIILIDYNLPPDIRSHLENLIAVGVIPGPFAPKDIDSFLFPTVSELWKLSEGVPTYDVRTDSMFLLHAYLIYAFGDGPAAAKIMLMKGANGKSPCRACTITGVRIPGNSRNPIHYVPLARTSNSYDPLNLPMRTHAEFMRQAVAVISESRPGRAEDLAKLFGIKGVPLLSTLSSMSFPESFPLDFMHMIWENVVKTLVMLWTKDFKKLDSNTDQPYHIKKTVWEAIGKATAEAASTIPSAFGCRVPNIAQSRGEFTAEAYSIWTLFLGPVLLCRAFAKQEYYDHFLKLVRLITLCLRFEITRREVEEIHRGFAEWVETYERIYYQDDLTRLPTCTLNIHGLLHIAFYILTCGPVWCYWAFPMERFCGRLLRTMKSRRYPFASLDKRVCELAQLQQLKHIYNLWERLDLSRQRKVEVNGYRTPGYPVHVTLQQRSIRLSDQARRRVAHHLAIRFDLRLADALRLIPAQVTAWGKLQRLECGDMMHAAEIVKTGPQSRDMTFVKYSQLVDRNAQFPRRPSVWIQQNFYGQVCLFLSLSVTLPPSPGRTLRQHVLLGLLRPCVVTSSNNIGVLFYKDLGALEVIDVQAIEGLIGRVKDRSRWAIVEREGIFRQIQLVDEEAREEEAGNALARS